MAPRAQCCMFSWLFSRNEQQPQTETVKKKKKDLHKKKCGQNNSFGFLKKHFLLFQYQIF